jgi:hypothetical protein
MPEEWRPITGYDYEVSNKGRVRSLGHYRNNRWGTQCWHDGKILNGEARNRYGHRRVTLYRDRKPTRRAVHQLVLEAFGDPRPEGMWALHRDGDPSNNAIKNLYWGTPSDNQYDKVRHGNNQNANKTHCPRGHSYDRVRFLHGKYRGRYCATCARDAKKENAA